MGRDAEFSVFRSFLEAVAEGRVAGDLPTFNAMLIEASLSPVTKGAWGRFVTRLYAAHEAKV
tara:strand:+ start:314 stop:499 length:186 start_codon:yes stop_codon:yes gene_type:complete